MNCQWGWVLGVALLLVATLCHGEDRGSARQSITLAIGGDMIGPYGHPIPLKDPKFAKAAHLFQNADVGFANQEGSIFDLWNFAGYPAAENGGGRPLQSSGFASEIRAMGISLVSKANNHATDYGDRGLVETLENLRKVGIVAAGAGLSENEARAPGYLIIPKGLIALVATTSTFPPMSVAGDSVVHHVLRDGQEELLSTYPRPGISPLHVLEVRLLPRALFASLSTIGGPFALRQGPYLRISDQLFAPAPKIGKRWVMEASDEAAILRSIAEARARARLVIFSIHAHETSGDDYSLPPVPFEPMVLARANEAPSPDDPRPTSFEVRILHAAIDHGADIAIRHGNHEISGIEIYKGRPIFYGVASLFLDFGGQRVGYSPGGEKEVAPDSWFESIVPVCTFRAHRLQTCKIYPITIDPNAGPGSGDPAIAGPKQGRAILERLKKLSAAFGTKVEISKGVGLLYASG